MAVSCERLTSHSGGGDESSFPSLISGDENTERVAYVTQTCHLEAYVATSALKMSAADSPETLVAIYHEGFNTNHI